MRHGRAEERQHGVTDELLHRAAVSLQLGAQPQVIAGEQSAHVLGIELLRARRETDQVAEEHGDDLPLLAWLLRHRRLLGGRWGQSRILVEQLFVQLPQLGPGLDPELLDQQPPCLLIERQRFGLPPAAVERKHQLRPRTLSEWLLAHDRLEV